MSENIAIFNHISLKWWSFHLSLNKKMSFDDFFMTTWKRENESVRKKEPQISGRIGELSKIGYHCDFKINVSKNVNNNTPSQNVIIFLCMGMLILVKKIFLILYPPLKYSTTRILNKLIHYFNHIIDHYSLAVGVFTVKTFCQFVRIFWIFGTTYPPLFKYIK